MDRTTEIDAAQDIEIPYIYEPIDSATEIRIIELSPLKTKAWWPSNPLWTPKAVEVPSLRCELVTAKLSDDPKYEALSYVWGERVFDDKIVLPSGTLRITSRLGAALRELRRTKSHNRLWVDAICIHQDDVDEKGHQVALMSKIYRQTQGVVAWLGEGSRETAYAMHVLESISDSSSKYGVDPANLDFQIPTEMLPQHIFRELGALGSKFSGHDLDNDLELFFRQEWFKRLWIVQEVALPSQVTLINGSRQLKFEHFMIAMSVLMLRIRGPNCPISFQKFPTDFQNAWDLAAMRVTTQDHERERVEESEPEQQETGRPGYKESDILELVVSNADRHCQQPKDRINALLGLQGRRNSERIRVTVDYSVPDRITFQNFTMSHLQNGDLRPLYYAGKILHICDDNHLPSWVPDWRCNHTRLEARIGHPRAPPFSACKDVKPIISLGRVGIIGIQGTLIDIVKKDLSSLVPGRKRDIQQILQENINAIFPWEENMCINVYKKTKYHTGETPEKAFARTLVLNNRDGIRAFTSSVSGPESPHAVVDCWRLSKCYSKHRQPCILPLCSKSASRSGGMPDFAYIRAARIVGLQRTFFMTKSNYMGLGPVPLEPGDAIVVFDGAEAPFVLRKVTGKKIAVDQERWEIIGDCYLHGFMNNDVLKERFRGLQKQTFWIV